jgi:hypothetical protein
MVVSTAIDFRGRTDTISSLRPRSYAFDNLADSPRTGSGRVRSPHVAPLARLSCRRSSFLLSSCHAHLMPPLLVIPTLLGSFPASHLKTPARTQNTSLELNHSHPDSMRFIQDHSCVGQPQAPSTSLTPHQFLDHGRRVPTVDELYY